MLRSLSISLSIAGAALATAVQAEGYDTFYRVFIGDHASATITALDLSDPVNRWTFTTEGQNRLYPLAGGQVIAAVQSDDDTIHFFDSGVALDDHEDHADLSVADPAALGDPLTGPRPFHVVSHDGTIAINFDQGGYNLLLRESALADGRIEPVEFPQSVAHHGFAAPMGDLVLSTVASDAPVEGDAAPARLGLQAFAPDGTPAGDLATCTAIHGEAFSGGYLAAGCAEGVIVAQPGATDVSYTMIAYPDDFPDGTTGTLHGGRGVRLFLGNHGADGLAVIDPTGEVPMTRIALPFRRVDFLLDPVRPYDGWTLTEDGSLHRINTQTGEITASAQITGPYSMDGHWNDPRPRLAVAGDSILVTDPVAGVLRVVSAETLTETSAIAVDGIPYNLAVVGGSGAVH